MALGSIIELGRYPQGDSRPTRRITQSIEAARHLVLTWSYRSTVDTFFGIRATETSVKFQLSKRFDNLKPEYHGFDISRHYAIRRFISRWIEARVKVIGE